MTMAKRDTDIRIKRVGERQSEGLQQCQQISLAN
jgi:hypothetical protein